MQPRTPLAALAAFLAFVSLAPAAAPQIAAPDGWKWITDAAATHQTDPNPAADHWRFVDMAPGWHVTTRPAVTLYRPDASGRGRFALEAETFLFPGDSASGFGLLAGGREMERAPRFVAFLIRRDGTARVERHESGRVMVVRDWEALAAIVPGKADGTARNVLRLEVSETASRFLVNGEPAAEVALGSDALTGAVGLRVGPEIDLHVSSLDLTHRLAPVPEPK